MYLSEHQLAKLAILMRVLAEPLDEQDIRTQIGYLLLDLLNADHYASYVWDSERGCFDHGVSIGMTGDNLGHYESYYQFNDPITLKLQQHTEPVRVTDILPQHELIQTEFFNDFLRKDGLYWGVNMYAWIDGMNIGDVRIWRGKNGENFDANDMALLTLIKPAFIAALKRCRGASVSSPALPSSPSDTTQDLAQALSSREQQVVKLAAQGLSDKEIARALQISFTTVRTHMNHAFRKLNVDNRIKLLHAAQHYI